MSKNFILQKISDYYSLDIKQGKFSTEITMKLFIDDVTSYYMPHVLPTLKRYLPGVLKTACFNENNLSFKEEVVDTEIGHLFEHILLENMCKVKEVNNENSCIEYSGETYWNWKIEPKGTFHINISSGQDDAKTLNIALEKSIKLLDLILDENALNKGLQFQSYQFLYVDTNLKEE